MSANLMFFASLIDFAALLSRTTRVVCFLFLLERLLSEACDVLRFEMKHFSYTFRFASFNLWYISNYVLSKDLNIDQLNQLAKKNKHYSNRAS